MTTNNLGPITMAHERIDKLERDVLWLWKDNP